MAFEEIQVNAEDTEGPKLFSVVFKNIFMLDHSTVRISPRLGIQPKGTRKLVSVMK